ncbi:uncharacterized protein LOC103972153 isoform X1 [Musa acuminata AAA Group]|uniref:uncharacterized protein LOC103972153 isoform X1 n=1 Tax=Musa acuminata AAA Group TaxID=214697 RepID=UPI0031E1B50F
MVVTRRHARPESNNAARLKLYRAAEAEIGSRVFPLPAPPPAPMPSVGARRSTRVYVAKASSASAAANACGDGDSRVLRSGKRSASWKNRDAWLGAFGGDATADLRWWQGEEGEKRDLGGPTVRNDAEACAGVVVTESPEFDVPNDNLDSPQGKKFGIVYRRKRQRQLQSSAVLSSLSAGDGTAEIDRRFGLFFSRKGCRKRLKVAPLYEGIKCEPANVDMDPVETSMKRRVSKRELRAAVSALNFAKKIGIMEDSLCTCIGGPVVLLLLVELSCLGSSLFFSRLLIAILRWTRRATVSVREFAFFLLSGSLASVFSQQGVHVLPIRWHRDNNLFTNALPSFGLCKIYGARLSVPLVWLDFSALPFYFRSLHISMLVGSLYFPCVLKRHSMYSHPDPSAMVDTGQTISHTLKEAGYLGTKLSGTLVFEKHNSKNDAYKSITRNTTIFCGSRLSMLRRKRSSSRFFRSRNPSLMSSHPEAPLSLHSSQSGSSSSSEAEAGFLPEPMIRPLFIEVPDACAEDSFSCKDESDVSTPISFHRKQRKSAKKSPVEQNRELKSALAEVKQNIDSVHCNANVLVTDADRCWREEGFEVMLLLASKEWCIAVKSQGEVRYLHRPLDMRPCFVNRFTHAYMWAGDGRWKLEFLDKWDWLVFKELHMECHERNMQMSSRMIPVPVFKEVPGYEDDAGATFGCPGEYIRMMDDEVQRALSSKIAMYDMDSGDEQWLIKYNSSILHIETSEFVDITKDSFEEIIYAMEKDAYSNVDDVFDKEKALDLYQHFGKREMLNAIYDYWIRKRNKRHAALVREFQVSGPPLRRVQLAHKPFLRKKRSTKRQRVQTPRAKPEVISQAGTNVEDLQRVQEAENAANRAVEFAIHLRNRAQILMANAELAVYKSVMALRIAESMGASDSPDLASFILD